MRALGAIVQQGLAQLAEEEVKQVVSEMGWSPARGAAGVAEAGGSRLALRCRGGER